MNDRPRFKPYDIHGDECRRLRAEGLSLRDVGKRLGISEHSVRNALTDDAKMSEINSLKKLAPSKKQQYGTAYAHLFRDAKTGPKIVKRISVPISKEVKDAADACIRAARNIPR